ncbi:helix-turn-helix domain containing protein, partial [Escherichia coli]|nr:helix-turn-helix domain containing protein [Escherichia coli]
MSQVSIAKEVECSRRTVQNVIAAYEENKAATLSQMAEMSTPEDELGGQPADFDQMAKNSTPNEDLEDQPATFSQIA